MHYRDAKEPASETDSTKIPVDLKAFTDLKDYRLANMVKGNISLQVISHAPLDAPAALCETINSELHAAIQQNANRLAAFATLPVSDPEAAADILEHCVTKMGFLGALIDNHTEDGTYYDGERYWPLFAMAEKLDVPIYIHPTYAADKFREMYSGNFSDVSSLALSAFGWGWHADTGLHILKLFAAGLFDKFPKLKLVIGHDGEMLPFQLDRTAPIVSRLAKTKRDFKTVWDENIWITTSGMFSLAPMACILRCTKIEHIMFSVDYPFSANEVGVELLARLKDSDLVSDEELDKIMYKNAEALLKIQVNKA